MIDIETLVDGLPRIDHVDVYDYKPIIPYFQPIINLDPMVSYYATMDVPCTNNLTISKNVQGEVQPKDPYMYQPLEGCTVLNMYEYT